MQPPVTPTPAPKPQSSPNLSILPIARPIILHGLHAPLQSPPIIRLQRPITIPSGLFTLPAANPQLIHQQPSSSSGIVHQFIPALRPTLPPMTVHDFPPKLPNDLEAEEDEEDEQSAQAADTYSDYMPLKRMRFSPGKRIRLISHLVRLGDRHPDPVVETSSLASVELPDITYQLTIPNEKIQLNTLSALQLETIVYASQRNQTFLSDGMRAGFLIGMEFRL